MCHIDVEQKQVLKANKIGQCNSKSFIIASSLVLRHNAFADN